MAAPVVASVASTTGATVRGHGEQSGDNHRYHVQGCLCTSANATLTFAVTAFVTRLEQQVRGGHTYVTPTEGVRKDRHRATQEAATYRQAPSPGR